MTTCARAGRLIAALVVALAAADAAAQVEIRAGRVPAGSTLRDPAAAFWADAPAAQVALLPQVMVPPMHLAPAVTGIAVQAVHDGTTIAFRLEWKDATRSDRILVAEFGDQVAVELPKTFTKDALPSPLMGNPGAPVEIWQWRAAFQADLERGRPVDTKDLYPNANIDVYPDQVLAATDARPYMGAVGVDNLITRAGRTPVLVQVAEGFGTLTIDPADQQADGQGAWRDGAWRVVVTHPLAGGAGDVQLAPGGETVAAFAVWDGGNREVGPRKAWAPWVPVRLAP